MKRKAIILAVGLAVMLSSCYKDKGNYNYSVNDMEIKLELPQSQYAIGERIETEPKITFAKGDNKDLSFRWSFYGKDISTERKLSWNATTIASGSLIVYVTDNKTGVTYVGSTRLEITSSFGREGWMVLSEKDGKSMLSYFYIGKTITTDPITENRTVTCSPYLDVYRTNNGEDLGSKPIRLLEHFKSTEYNGTLDVGNVWVMQEGGNGVIDLSGSTFLKELSLPRVFLSGDYPAGFEPYDIHDMTHLTFVVGKDGTVYSRKKEDTYLYHSGKFLDIPVRFENQPIDGRNIVWSKYYEAGHTLFYNAPTNSYLTILDHAYNANKAGTIAKINVPTAEYESKPKFTKMDNLGTKKPFYIGGYYPKNSDVVGYVALLGDSQDNKTYIQQFELGGAFYSNAATAKLLYEVEINLASIVDGVSKNVFHTVKYQEFAHYLFMSKGKELWFIDLNSDISTFTKYATFDGNITSMCSEIYRSPQLGVGLDNGKLHILDLSRDAINGKYNDKIILHTTENLGNIVQVRYKVKYGNGWYVDDL